MCFLKSCLFCKHQKEKIEKSLKLGILFLFSLILASVGFAVNGSSSFYSIAPYCTANSTFFNNCSQQPVKLNCYINNFQYVQFLTYNFNSTTYLAQQLANPNQRNWTLSTTLNQKNETANFVYNFSSAVVTDTQGNIAIFPQNILINQSCPDCFPHVVQVNSSCGSDDVKNITYQDLNNCTYPLPPSSTTSCDYCIPNEQCSSFTPPTCGLSTGQRTCNAVTDLNNCYAQTGLISDTFTGQLNDFTAICSFNDFRTNTTLLSTLKAQLLTSQYPYVETNTTIDMEIVVTLENSRVLISNVQMQILNNTIAFSQDNNSISFKKSIQIHETGDFPFIIIGRDGATQVFYIQGVFYSRRFVNVSVQLFEDRNMSKRYVNDLGHIIAIKNEENFKADSFENDLINSLEPLKKTNLLTSKLIKLNQSSYYSYKSGKRAFHEPYLNGKAILHLPVEPTAIWELRLLNAESSDEYGFDSYNYAQIKTRDVSQSNDVKLTNGKIETNLDVKLLVSDWDIRWWSMATKWVIISIIILLFIIAMVFVWMATNSIQLVVTLFVTLLALLPVLYVILNFLFN